jgi:SlyX protein
MTEERLVELETKLAYQEQALEQLNEAMLHQQRIIEQLERRLRTLGDRVDNLADPGQAVMPADERPPHY